MKELMQNHQLPALDRNDEKLRVCYLLVMTSISALCVVLAGEYVNTRRRRKVTAEQLCLEGIWARFTQAEKQRYEDHISHRAKHGTLPLIKVKGSGTSNLYRLSPKLFFDEWLDMDVHNDSSFKHFIQAKD